VVLSTVFDYYLMRVPANEEQAYIPKFLAYADVVSAEPNYVVCEGDPCTCCPPGNVCPDLAPCVELFPVTLTVDRSTVTPGAVVLT
jgi:hypothetical protein